VQVFTAKNKPEFHLVRSMTASAAATVDVNGAAHHADFMLPVDQVGPGDRIRFAVEDTASGRVGTSQRP
jgi:hypothetical protein